MRLSQILATHEAALGVRRVFGFRHRATAQYAARHGFYGAEDPGRPQRTIYPLTEGEERAAMAIYPNIVTYRSLTRHEFHGVDFSNDRRYRLYGCQLIDDREEGTLQLTVRKITIGPEGDEWTYQQIQNLLMRDSLHTIYLDSRYGCGHFQVNSSYRPYEEDMHIGREGIWLPRPGVLHCEFSVPPDGGAVIQMFVEHQGWTEDRYLIPIPFRFLITGNGLNRPNQSADAPDHRSIGLAR